MPSGKASRVCFSIFCFSCGCIISAVRFCTSSSISMPSIRSIGSRIFPFDLDIFCPCSSRTRPVMYTFLKGISPVNFRVIIIILATQKNMMSKPVTSTSVGWNLSKNSLSLGQPSVEKVHSADENQVSSTSSSWRSAIPSPRLCLARISASDFPTYTLPSSSYHAGMRCPHQSWRLMHQS